jgi:hypothetical protein
VDVRWRPPLSAAIVTHFVTRSLLAERVNAAIYCTPLSSILAGQQRNGQVAGTRDTVYASDAPQAGNGAQTEPAVNDESRVRVLPIAWWRTWLRGARRHGSWPPGDLTREERPMTGPEHYKQAETLLIQAAAPDSRSPDPEPVTGDRAPHPRAEERGQTIARAHVHATLALAAAVALRPSGRESTMAGRTGNGHTRRAWEQVAGEPKPNF